MGDGRKKRIVLVSGVDFPKGSKKKAGRSLNFAKKARKERQGGSAAVEKKNIIDDRMKFGKKGRRGKANEVTIGVKKNSPSREITIEDVADKLYNKNKKEDRTVELPERRKKQEGKLLKYTGFEIILAGKFIASNFETTSNNFRVQDFECFEACTMVPKILIKLPSKKSVILKSKRVGGYRSITW